MRRRADSSNLLRYGFDKFREHCLVTCYQFDALESGEVYIDLHRPAFDELTVQVAESVG